MAAKQNDLFRTHHFPDDLGNALNLKLLVFRKMGKGRFHWQSIWSKRPNLVKFSRFLPFPKKENPGFRLFLVYL